MLLQRNIKSKEPGNAGNTEKTTRQMPVTNERKQIKTSKYILIKNKTEVAVST